MKSSPAFLAQVPSTTTIDLLIMLPHTPKRPLHSLVAEMREDTSMKTKALESCTKPTRMGQTSQNKQQIVDKDND